MRPAMCLAGFHLLTGSEVTEVQYAVHYANTGATQYDFLNLLGQVNMTF